MAPIPPSSHSVIPPSWKAHPLWKIRKYTLLALLPTFFLSCSIRDPTFFIISTILSSILIIYDLASYINAYLKDLFARLNELEAKLRTTASQDPSSHGTYEAIPETFTNTVTDEPPPSHKKWPRRIVMLGDLALAVTFFLLGIGALCSGLDTYYNSGRAVANAYASMGLFVLSVLHGIAYYREWKALKTKVRAKRRAEMRREVLGIDVDDVEGEAGVGCEVCGRVVVVSGGKSGGGGFLERVFGEAAGDVYGGDVGNVIRSGIGRVRRDVKTREESARLVRTPSASSEGDNEPFEHLGCMEGGYGSLGESHGSLSGPVHVVKKKKSKRAIGEEWDKKGKGKGPLIADVDA